MNPTATLAISDGWTIAMFAVNLSASIVMAVALLWVRGRTAKIDGLECEVKQYATDLIDTKIGVIGGAVADIKKRLEQGDAKFEKVNERDHGIELKTLQAIESLRHDFVDRMATKGELMKLQEQMQRHAVALAELSAA